jgi:hypothetical protein
MPNITPIPLTSGQRDLLLDHRIPDRMFEIHLGKAMIDCLSNKEPTKIIFGTDKPQQVSAGYLLAGAAVDTAMMMCRALLDFIGVHLKRVRTSDTIPSSSPVIDNHYLATRHGRPKPDDVMLIDLGKGLVTIEEAKTDSRRKQSNDVYAALHHMLLLANKSIGHVTKTSAREEADWPKLSLACDQVILLMNRHVYNALALPSISFSDHTDQRHLVTL